MATVAIPGIESGRVYQLFEFMKLAGIGRHAFRTARDNGLRVIRTAGRCYVRGDDWFDYLDKVAEQQGGEGAPE